MGSRNIFAPINRGWLLDLVVFVANLALMSLLTRNFVALARFAYAGDSLARIAIGVFFASYVPAASSGRSVEVLALSPATRGKRWFK